MEILILCFLFIIVLLICSFLFFVTGGCVTLVRTALNDKLRADIKFRWMLGQVYFPPTSIAYLALIEKSRKFQIIGALAVLLATYLPIHFISSHNWREIASQAPTILKSFEEGFEEGFNEAKEQNSTKEIKQTNHKQEDALNKKYEALKIRLAEIQKKALDPKDLQNIRTAKLTLSLSTRAYASGSMSENDYTKLIEKFDAITAAGILSDQDAKDWIAQASILFNKNKTAPHSNISTTPATAATAAPPSTLPREAPGQISTTPDPQRLNDSLSQQAEQVSARMFSIYNALPPSPEKIALNETDAILGNLRGAYVYQN
jgi:hypothetical protein